MVDGRWLLWREVLDNSGCRKRTTVAHSLHGSNLICKKCPGRGFRLAGVSQSTVVARSGSLPPETCPYLKSHKKSEIEVQTYKCVANCELLGMGVAQP